MNYIEGFRSNSSNVLTTRKYYVESETIQPALAWQPTSRIRLVGTFTWKEKVNTFNETSNETASIQEVGLESRFSKAGKTTLRANLRYVDIDFVGIETSSVGYEMLEALRPGQNITWNVSWQQGIGTGLQLVLRYDGRKSGENQAVHLGRV